MAALVTCRFDIDPIKNEGAILSCSQHFLHYNSMGKSFDAQGQVTPSE